MSESKAEDRIEALVQELEPVRPIPRLRTLLALALALVPLAVVAHFVFGGPGLRGPVGAAERPVFVGLLVGLLLVAGGALAAAFARAVPGREAAGRRGGKLAVAGGALALLASGVGVGLVGRGEVGLAECIGCIRHAVGLGVLPFAVVIGFVLRAFADRFGPAILLGVIGGVALGAAAVHLTCGSDQPMHWLLGHALGPVVLGLILAGPALLLVGRSGAGGRDGTG
ncbi:MAG: NrsF family protein [Myxococcota bacterium]